MKKPLLILTALGLCSAMMLSGCSGKAGTTSTNITQVKTTFRFITANSDAGSNKIFAEAVATLQKKYPNVTFTNDSSASGTYNDKIKLASVSGNPYNMIYTDDLGLAPLAENNDLLDLTPYIKKYNWINKQLPGTTNFYNQRYPNHEYTVGMNSAPLVVFYNKTIFKKLGLQVPTTLAQFENCMKVASANGYIGLEDAAQPQNLWLLESLVQNAVPLQDVINWYYLKSASPAFATAYENAGTLIKSWSDAGYFRKNYQGVNYGETPQLFGQGKSAMSFDGNWNLSTYQTTGVNFGMFPLPCNTTAGAPNYIINPVNAAWAISSKANPTQVAIGVDLINLMMSNSYAAQWETTGALPTYKMTSTAPTANQQTVDQLTAAIKKSKFGFYLDNAKPGILDLMTKELQIVLAGQETSKQMWNNVNAFWSQNY